MRKESYDKLLVEGIKKIQENPRNVVMANEKIKAFETILNETNMEKLEKYYRNMDEFYGANNTDITLMLPHYLLTEIPHTCDGKSCTFEAEEPNANSHEEVKE